MIQAIADYSKALKINPFYVKAYNNRGNAYFDLKKYDKAWDNIRAVEEIGGTVDLRLAEALKKISANGR